MGKRGIPDNVDKILRNSSKAELLEELSSILETRNKAIVVLIEDKGKGSYSIDILMMGISNSYEACGILEVAKHDLQEDDLV